MTNKEEFCSILRETCKDRFDVEKFIAFLDKTDFFSAPASSKYHLSTDGGLCQHSLNVYHTLHNLCQLYDESIPQSSIAICGLLHDFCKIGFYKKDFRNVKINGQWTSQPCYVVNDELPLGHGEKSVIMLMQTGMSLTTDEVLAIRWHMSGYDYAVKGGDFALSTAMSKSKLVVLLQAADIISSGVLEFNK